MTLYDAVLEVASPSGRRKVPMAQWGLGYMTPNLESNEVLVGLSWDVWDAPHGYAFLEFARRLGDFAIAGVACLVALDQSRSVVRSSISLIGIANCPVRVTAAEGLLKGSPITEQAIEAASAEASKIEANSDLFASGSYRQHLAGILTKRALKLANERARAAAQSTKSVPA
jgi:carbon-monoxide dehydrogenase medium subunit